MRKAVLGFCMNSRSPQHGEGGVQILKKEEEDARLLDRCEPKRKEWAKHWLCDEEGQNMDDKPADCADADVDTQGNRSRKMAADVSC